MNVSSVPSKAPGFYLDEVDGELIISQQGSEEGLLINETAALVWELCDGEARVEEIIEVLKESYPNASSEIADDVSATLELLAENKALLIS